MDRRCTACGGCSHHSLSPQVRRGDFERDCPRYAAEAAGPRARPWVRAHFANGWSCLQSEAGSPGERGLFAAPQPSSLAPSGKGRWLRSALHSQEGAPKAPVLLQRVWRRCQAGPKSPTLLSQHHLHHLHHLAQEDLARNLHNLAGTPRGAASRPTNASCSAPAGCRSHSGPGSPLAMSAGALGSATALHTGLPGQWASTLGCPPGRRGATEAPRWRSEACSAATRPFQSRELSTHHSPRSSHRPLAFYAAVEDPAHAARSVENTA